MSVIDDQLEELDVLAGCSPRSIQFLEAAWPKGDVITWEDALVAARQRSLLGAFDQADGKEVAFLEGMLVAMRTERR